jgi:hypothetical protein
MNGFGHLPNKSDQNTFVFYANASGSASGSFQAWNVPDHAGFLHFTVIGSGGGGGGGCGGAAAASGRGGGGGGAAGGVVAVSIPAVLLPKTLYLQVGYGGAPGTGSSDQTLSGQSGQAGTISYVCLYPEINAGSVLIQSSNTAPGGGTGGSGAAPAGTAITLADTNNLKWLGIVGNTVAQTAGGAGAATGVGASVTYAGILTGGASGGVKPGNAVGTAGGSIVMSTNYNSHALITIAGGAGSSTVAGGDGSNGFFNWKPFLSTGGAGGGGTSALGFNGGTGGAGSYGCGGGGGGASRSTAGSGGKGGDGLIIITVA